MDTGSLLWILQSLPLGEGEGVWVHVATRVSDMTVYPAGACIPDSGRPVEAVEGALPLGKGLLIADGWYDDEESMEVMVERGYRRRRLRDVFEVLADNYRNRPRGESTSGSLTNRYGERLKTSRIDTTAVQETS